MQAASVDQWALLQAIDASARVATAAERNRIRAWAEYEIGRRQEPGTYARGQRVILRSLLKMLAARP